MCSFVIYRLFIEYRKNGNLVSILRKVAVLGSIKINENVFWISGLPQICSKIRIDLGHLQLSGAVFIFAPQTDPKNSVGLPKSLSNSDPIRISQAKKIIQSLRPGFHLYLPISTSQLAIMLL
jgi:hypothetical protein